MPRISLYKPEKGHDYAFLDKTVNEMFTVGGTDVFVHKHLGPMPGDVFELPHLKDEHALNDFNLALKRYYVVEDISRAAEGFSVSWYPHLYRVKLKQIVDSQEFKGILDLPAGEGSSQT